MDSSFRWPPSRPEGLDRRYRYSSGATRFQTVGAAVFVAGVAQSLWQTNPWWVQVAGWAIAVERTTWLVRRVHADGGFTRTRNPIERVLLFSPVLAMVAFDLTVAASTLWHLAQ